MGGRSYHGEATPSNNMRHNVIMHMNKKSIILAVAFIMSIAISGCATNQGTTPMSSLSTKNDIFPETLNSDTPTGNAITDIKFSVKSISSRFFGIYNKHSNPSFRVYLNIDGQTTILDSEPVLEDKSSVAPDTPESGTGWRYQFNKRITLAPGKHKLTIAIPVDDVMVERDIELHAGANTLTLIPVYKKRPSQRPYKKQHFSAGVKTLEVII